MEFSFFVLNFPKFYEPKVVSPTLPWICADTVKLFSPRFLDRTPVFRNSPYTYFELTLFLLALFKKIFHAFSIFKNQTVTKPVLAKCNTPFSRAAWEFWAKRASFICSFRFYPRSRTVAVRGFWAKHKIRAVCTLIDGW